MSATAEAVIVGGGVMGCSILYNLVSRGLKNVALLERDVLASGSTGRSQAILRMHYSNEVTTRMAWESLQVYREFDQIVGGSSGYTRTGYLLAVDGADRPALEENVAMQRAVGVNTDVVPAADLLEVAPMCAALEDEAFAFEPDSGYADPYSVTTAYARRAREMGARVITSTAVTDIEVSGGRVAAVTTPQDRIETTAAVLCAGPWSRPLFRRLGIDVPLETVRHQVITLRRPDELPHHPVIGDVANDLSARPELGSLTLIGVGEDEVASPDDYNQGVDLQTAEQAMRRMLLRVPGMRESLYRGGWSGLFTITPDWHPILGRVPGVDGLYCAVGFSGHGFKLAPMVGVAMAETIVDGRAETIDISMLDFDRFEQDRLLCSRYSMSVLA